MYFSIYTCLNDVKFYCLLCFVFFLVHIFCHMPFFVMYDYCNVQKLKIKTSTPKLGVPCNNVKPFLSDWLHAVIQ